MRSKWHGELGVSTARGGRKGESHQALCGSSYAGADVAAAGGGDSPLLVVVLKWPPPPPPLLLVLS